MKLWVLIRLVISQEVLSNTLSKEKGLQEKNNELKAEVKKIYGFMYDSLKTEKDAISQHIDSYFVSSPNWPQFVISLK